MKKNYLNHDFLGLGVAASVRISSFLDENSPKNVRKVIISFRKESSSKNLLFVIFFFLMADLKSCWSYVLFSWSIPYWRSVSFRFIFLVKFLNYHL